MTKIATGRVQGLISVEHDVNLNPVTLHFRNFNPGTQHTMPASIVKLDDLLAFINGTKLIQDCFPYLDISTRELFLSGMNQEEWAAIFPPDEED